MKIAIKIPINWLASIIPNKRSSRVSWGAALIVSLPVSVLAQVLISTDSDRGLPAPLRPVTDINGVDMISGRYEPPQVGLSIGSATNGLSSKFFWRAANYGGAVSLVRFYSGDNMEDYTQVTLGGVTDLFYGRPGAQSYRPKVPRGQSLEFLPDYAGSSSGIYTYYTKDGTKALYGTAVSAGGNVATNTQVVKPDGENINLYYSFDSQASEWLITAVASSNGWLLKYNYSDNPIKTTLQASKIIKNISAINLSSEYVNCDLGATYCAISGSWPNVSFDYDSSGLNCVEVCISFISKVSDPMGHGYVITRIPGPAHQPTETARFGETLTFPSGRVVTRYYDSANRTVSVSLGGSVWQYSYSDTPTARVRISNPSDAEITSISTDPLGHSRKFSAQLFDGYVSRVIDEINVTYEYKYDPITYLNSSILMPEGNSIEYKYDDRGNITSVRQVAKSGSGLLDIVATAGYDEICTNHNTCNQPNWTKDAKGAQTDYVYDPIHGGLVTETGPAAIDPVNGQWVRPQKRYTYSKLYPMVKNSSGGLVSSTPVWRLTRVSTCRTATTANPAACVGTANETVIEYAYDSNNLLKTAETVRAGNADTAQAYSSANIWARTTYAYDNYGNLVSIDGPRTDVDDKSYATYDLIRRKVFEIGPDPDGGGPLKRIVIRHNYDADGREYLTETGVGASIVFAGTVPTDVSDFTVQSFVRRTFDSSTGLLIKTETVRP
jgi:hypothetical protein